MGSKNNLIGNKKITRWILEIPMRLLEVALDIKEGADMIMVKPGLPYLGH